MDLCLKFGDERLNIRVGSLIIHDGKLLCAHSARPYWHSLGGRIHLGESSKQAAEREAFEETGFHFEADRLLFSAELFFTEQTTGEKFHEITYYYLMKPNGREQEIADSFMEGDATERLAWFDIKTLADVDLRPAIIAKVLNGDLSVPRHIIVREDEKGE